MLNYRQAYIEVRISELSFWVLFFLITLSCCTAKGPAFGWNGLQIPIAAAKLFLHI